MVRLSLRESSPCALSPPRSGRVTVTPHGEPELKEEVFQGATQNITNAWRPAQVILPTWSDTKRHHSLRFGWIHGYLGRPAGWEPGVHQSYSDRDCGESGKDQTGVWQFLVLTRGWAQPDPNQRSYREIIAWKYVSHPNVLPFLGVSQSLLSFCIITPWLRNGNIGEYVQKHREANRLRLVSDYHNNHKRITGDPILYLACAGCLRS